MTNEHTHNWGSVELSRFAGNPHRKCLECNDITLDLGESEHEDE